MSCHKVSNNKYFDSPALMSDGRQFTDYRPSCDMNNMLRVKNSLPNSFKYRMFMTNNAEKIMDLNRVNACNINCSKPCNGDQVMLPEQTRVTCNKENCDSVALNSAVGLGQGRETGMSNDLKNNYVNNQPYNCCSSGPAVFNYHGETLGVVPGQPQTRVQHNNVPQPHNL